ncbi:MAG: hypothetical protein IKD58_00955 [Loktanella sp.]|nr:hypothetical protein [Loktanella sp.]
MPTILKKIALTAALAAIMTSGGASGIAPFDVSAAYAQGNSGDRGASRSAEARGRSAEARSNGQGRGNGASAANLGLSNGVGRGALASELKGLNAAHANPQALANAAPNSMPGKLAAFRDEYVDVLDAAIAFRDATDALAAYPPFESTFDEDTIEHEEALALYELERTLLEEAVRDAEDALIAENATYNESYFALTGGVQLSPEAETELLRLLGLQ